jgi:serine/threonine-protein phosphatase 5
VINSIDFQSVQIEKSWTGPELEITSSRDSDGHLSVDIQGVNIEYLKYAIKHFKEGGRLPKRHVFAIIAKVNEILRTENTLVEISLPHAKIDHALLDKPDDILLTNGKTITVVGDTHGQFYDVMNLFDKFGFVSDEHIYLINGDFVDRGSWSCEVALYYYILKILYPKSFYINRGNHETDDMNKSYGFSDECEHKYSKKVFDAFSESFGALPLATLINQAYLVMHGGLFSDDKITIDDIKKFNRLPSSGSTQPPRDGIAMELLWTDPQPQNGRSPSKRGLGMQFGPDITERFCLTNKIRKILRSHESRDNGVEVEHNGRLITVFSAPNYCDATGNLGGVVNFTPNPDYDPSIDDGEGYRIIDDKNCPWNLELKTFECVPHPDIKPMAYSKGAFGY